MTTEHHPYDYRWEEQFPDAMRIASAEGGTVYTAEADGARWVIIDEGSMADLLAPEDADLLERAVAVQRFDDVERWRAEIARIQRRCGTARVDSHLPELLQISVAGEMGDSFALLFEGDDLLYQHFEHRHHPVPAEPESAEPEAWNAFRRALTYIDAWAWSGHYRLPYDHLVMDGTQGSAGSNGTADASRRAATTPTRPTATVRTALRRR